MADEQQDRVDIETHVAASPDEVFDYVTDPARFPGPGDLPALGEPIEVDAAGWRVTWPDVEVTLRPDGDGTHVRVVHRLTGSPRAALASGAPRLLALAA